uniref:Uncharacterized protein n=1 Tax=Avena sativa TaxID=4498 RepID=A0ACD5UEF7_AVESA
MENVGKNDQEDALKDVAFSMQPVRADLDRLMEMANSEKGASQMEHFVKHWEYKRATASRLLSEELGLLSQQRKEAEQQISAEEESNGPSHNQELKDEAEDDTVSYWKQRALRSEKAHETSLKNFQPHAPVEEFSEILKRADFFLHLILQSAPIVIAHQDVDLRYRFIFNHFPTLADEDVIGKTDHDILSGEGVDEMNNVKRQVMAMGMPTKREFVFHTPLFGAKTFLAYIEPVFTKSGETIGVNYVAMDITDQVRTREKIADIKVREAVQRAKEIELSRSLQIIEETMQAKQMLDTLCHDIRSPLSEVLSMAETLRATKLDQEQYQLLEVMFSSGNVAMQLINDIRDLSKLESGVMKLEPVIFRPREVVKHVLDTASTFMKKELTLEGCVGDDVPLEVMADVQKVQQILTNLITFSNATQYKQEGKVGINLNILDKQQLRCEIPSNENSLEHHKGEVIWLRFDVYDTGIGIPGFG